MANTKFKVEIVIETELDYAPTDNAGNELDTHKNGFIRYITDAIKSTLEMDLSSSHEKLTSLEVTEL